MSKIKMFLVILLAFFIVSIFYIAATSGISLENAQQIIKDFKFLAPVVFIVLYSIAPVFFIPITPLSVTAGILFGLWYGTFLTTIGASIGACIAFLVSRYLMKEWVDHKSPARVMLVQEKVQKEGWKFIAISRVTPIFPFNVQNYVFGLTNISFKTFLLTTLYSVIPGSFVYVYLGYTGKSIMSGDPNAMSKLFVAIVFIILSAVLPFIIKKYKHRKA